MKIFKKLLWHLIFPHVAFLILLVPLSAALLIYSFVFLDEQGIVNYISYALSAYTLTVLCFRTPQIIRFIKAVQTENRYIQRLITDAHLRVNLSLYGSLAFNTAYAIFQLGLGFYHRSIWFHALAVYYVLLAVMRFFLLRYTRTHQPGKNQLAELYRYRFCGWILLFMNLALSTIVFFITWQNRGFEHHYIITIAMAAYTFTSLTVAIVNVFKYRQYQSPVFSASKAINLAAALVSMLTLETAMLTAFGEENGDAFRRAMTGATGAAVTLFILVMAIYMIIRSNKKLKALQINNSET